MSLYGLKSKLAQRHRKAQQQRDLYRAINSAPTPAARNELLNLSIR